VVEGVPAIELAGCQVSSLVIGVGFVWIMRSS
jgi:hypothetical protein